MMRFMARGLIPGWIADLGSLGRQVGDERRRLLTLQEIGLAVGSTLEHDELLRDIVEGSTRLLEAERATLYLLDGDGESLVSRVAQGNNKSSEIRLKLNEGV